MGANRLDRVRELLKRELGEIIRKEFPVDKVGIITVNHVDVSADLHSAAVFISAIGTANQRRESLKRLQKKTKYIQGLLARSIVLKHSPKLKFFSDKSIEKGDKVLEIINELEKESPMIPDSDDSDSADPQQI